MYRRFRPVLEHRWLLISCSSRGVVVAEATAGSLAVKRGRDRLPASHGRSLTLPSNHHDLESLDREPWNETLTTTSRAPTSQHRGWSVMIADCSSTPDLTCIDAADLLRARVLRELISTLRPLLLAALDDAIEDRLERADGYCYDCGASENGRCATHQDDLDRAAEYRRTYDALFAALGTCPTSSLRKDGRSARRDCTTWTHALATAVRQGWWVYPAVAVASVGADGSQWPALSPWIRRARPRPAMRRTSAVAARSAFADHVGRDAAAADSDCGLSRRQASGRRPCRG
jgi:hypothetical protein